MARKPSKARTVGLNSEFKRRVLRKITQALFAKALPPVSRASKTLGKVLRPVLGEPYTSSLYIPHYWAVYLHDGRTAPISPQEKKVLVYFRDPRNDPRIKSGYPVRLAGAKRLTPEQFYEWSQRNKEAKALGLPPPMIVTPLVTGKAEPKRFFENEAGGGMFGAAERANQAANAEVLSFLRSELSPLREEDKVSISL